jgi:hypothetical protein
MEILKGWMGKTENFLKAKHSKISPKKASIKKIENSEYQLIIKMIKIGQINELSSLYYNFMMKWG